MLDGISDTKMLLKRVPPDDRSYTRSTPHDFSLNVPFMFVVFEPQLSLILLIGHVTGPDVMNVSPQQPRVDDDDFEDANEFEWYWVNLWYFNM